MLADAMLANGVPSWIESSQDRQMFLVLLQSYGIRSKSSIAMIKTQLW